MKTIQNKTKKMLGIEEKFNMNIEEVLRVKFVDRNLPVKEISEQLGTSYVTTTNWLKLAGVYSRNLNIS